MILFLYYFLWIINIVLTLYGYRRKSISILSVVLFFCIFISNPGVTGDAYKYRIDYEDNAFGAEWSEVGYNLFKAIAHSLGIATYSSFLIAVAIFCFLLIFCGMKKLGNNYSPIFMTTMEFILPSFATTIRFFMAFSIFVFALPFLFDNKKIKYYILLILFATTFHRAAIFFLIMVLCVQGKGRRIVHSKTIRKIFTFFVVAFSITCVAVTYITKKFFFADILVSFFSSVMPGLGYKLSIYIATITRFGAMIFFIIYAANLIASINMHKAIRQSIGKNSQNNLGFLYYLSKSTYYCNILCVSLLPLLVLNLAFYRLLVLPTFMNAILLGNISKHNNLNTTKKIKYRNAAICYLLLAIVWIIPEILKINSISISGMIQAARW